MALSSRPGNQPKLRDPLRDYLKAVDDQIAERESVGVAATPYLLAQKAELEARLGIVEPGAEPLERKDAAPAPETVTPRGPGRPRKPTDADRAASS
jgi:hypothetical protein